MNEEKPVSTFKEVTVSISMSKSVYLEVPEGITDEQLISKAKEDILTPDKIMPILVHILKQYGVRVDTHDVAGWDVDELEYVVEDGGNTTSSEGKQPDA